eukprot:PhF_6_TR41596/c0_g1_i1/m.63033
MYWLSRPMEELYGHDTQVKFVRAFSGDQVLVMLPDGDVIPLRLRQIDAPEIDQQSGPEATRQLESLLSGPNKELVAFIWDREKQGYYVADLLVRKDVRTALVHVQMYMVENGWAWHLGGFEKESPLKAAMAKAMQEKKGLWGYESPMQPWKFRRIGEIKSSRSRETMNRREREEVDVYEQQRRKSDKDRRKKERYGH